MTVIRARAIEFWAVTFAFCVAAATFFRSVLFRSDRVIPWDFVDSGYPHYFFVDKWIHRHVFPAWDPHIAFGVPLAGEMGSQLLYFPTYLQSVFGNPLSIRVIEVTLVAHIVLSAVGMYYLCRALSLHPLAASAAGVIFAFGGFFPNKVQHPTWVHSAAWMPLAVLALERFITSRRIRYIACLVIVLLLMLLAGFWQQTMYSMYFLFAWSAYRTCALMRAGVSIRSSLAPLIAFLVACSSALLCAACELIPSFESASNSMRQSLTLGDSVQGSMSGTNLLTILFPGLFTGEAGDAILLRLGDPSMLYSYAGTIVLLLLVYAASMRTRGVPNHRLFLWVALVISLILAAGASTPLYGLCFKFVPGFSFFRRPLSFYFFAVFSASILAGYALDDLLSVVRAGNARFVRQLALILACCGGVIALSANAGRDLLASLVVSLQPRDPANQVVSLVVETALTSSILFGFGGALLWGVTRSRRWGPIWGSALVIACFTDLCYFNSGRVFDAGKLKVSGLATELTLLGDPLPGHGILSGTTDGPYRTAIAGYGGLFDNGGDIVGYENPGGYFLFRSKRYGTYFSEITGPGSPLLSLANIRYLLTSPPFLVPSQQPMGLSATQNRVALRSGPVPEAEYTLVDMTVFNWYRLFRNTKALPRYYFSSAVQVVRDEHERLSVLNNPDFVERRATVLENDLPVKIDNCSSEAVTVISYIPTAVRLRANSSGNCLLVASDAFDPGWRAYSDGKEVPVYLANHLFRAIYLAAGKHDVEMRYEPALFRIGLTVSISASAILICLYVLFWRRIDRFLADGKVQT
jgi:hypothetical protein